MFSLVLFLRGYFWMNLPRLKLRLVMAIAACILATPIAAKASTLTYTATGGLITGTLNGTPFTNATWSIVGTADPTNVVPGNISGAIPYNFLAMAPFLTIHSGSSTLTATLETSGSTGDQVGAFSLDFNVFDPGVSSSVFSYLNGDGSSSSVGMGVAGAGLYTTLQSPFFGSGTQNNGISGSYFTDIGLMVISSNTDQAATFTIVASSVPEIDPATGGSALSLVAGVLAMIEQRRRRATLVA
jgi:hypothetical protein